MRCPLRLPEDVALPAVPAEFAAVTAADRFLRNEIVSGASSSGARYAEIYFFRHVQLLR